MGHTNLPKISIDEAIKAMENIRDYWTTRPTEQAAAQMAIEALKEKREREVPKPLTKEQIKDTKGRNIYIQMIYNGKPTDTAICVFWNGSSSIFKLKDYGITWRAFHEMPSQTENF